MSNVNAACLAVLGLVSGCATNGATALDPEVATLESEATTARDRCDFIGAESRLRGATALLEERAPGSLDHRAALRHLAAVLADRSQLVGAHALLDQADAMSAGVGDAESARAWRLRASLYGWADHLDDRASLLDRASHVALDTPEESNDDRLQRANDALIRGDYAEVRELATAALAEAHKLKDAAGEVDALSLLAEESVAVSSAESTTLLGRALEILDGTAGELPECVEEGLRADVLGQLAVVLSWGNNDESGVALLEQVHANVVARLGADHPSAAVAAHDLARVYTGLDRPNEALPLLQSALAVEQQSFGASALSTVSTLAALAEAQIEAGDLDSAERSARRAMAISTGTRSAPVPDQVFATAMLGRLLMRRGASAEARALLRKALPQVALAKSWDSTIAQMISDTALE